MADEMYCSESEYCASGLGRQGMTTFAIQYFHECHIGNACRHRFILDSTRWVLEVAEDMVPVLIFKSHNKWLQTDAPSPALQPAKAVPGPAASCKNEAPGWRGIFQAYCCFQKVPRDGREVHNTNISSIQAPETRDDGTTGDYLPRFHYFLVLLPSFVFSWGWMRDWLFSSGIFYYLRSSAAGDIVLRDTNARIFFLLSRYENTALSNCLLHCLVCPACAALWSTAARHSPVPA